MKRENSEGALIQLRAYIAQGEFATNDRLPAERELCETLGIGRSELRKAFAVLESEGAIWRHVGRGTFVGNGRGQGPDYLSIADIAKRTTPREVMHARLVLEPMLAREAAMHATAEHVEQMSDSCAKAREATTWRQYESIDNQFHSLVTEATQNTPLITMYEQLNALRRTIVWGCLHRRTEVPTPEHHSFVEHEAILDAIEHRNADAAQACMKRHLQAVRDDMFPAD
ncbi:FadR/GntR family transcriptional regulator [Granulosicoccus sp. 3-233]|uniref:FadR/GntR family transcriptional regulator n=1 Tax=Granulosicoccus sp. 3-233 TaxID=3417969 RepID=UPI003D34D19F